MSLVPEFELGLWNGWIFLIPYILIFGSFNILLKKLSLIKKESKIGGICRLRLFAWHSEFRVMQVWFCGKVIAKSKVTVWVGDLSCLKANL